MKEIPNMCGYYATTDGRIYSSKSNRFLKLLMSNSGYLKFNAYYGSRGSLRNVFVHRAVCYTYHGLPEHGQEVRHLDGNKLNNQAENLCWGSSKDNHEDQVRHGTANRGENNPFAKLSDSDVIEIRRLHAAGHSTRQLGIQYNVCRTTIGKITRLQNWRHI